MKIFLQREIREAYAYAAAGGQAVHVCESRAFVLSDAPACFRRSPQFAHLLDQDYQRLVRSARELGVRVIVPQRIGMPAQHVDLCGKPLQRALARAERIRAQEQRAAALAREEQAEFLLPLALGKGMP